MERMLVPLTQPQRRILFEALSFPDSPVHNIGGAVHFEGEPRMEGLRSAIRAFAEANDGLSLRLAEKGGEVFQYPDPGDDPVRGFEDFRGHPEPQRAFDEWSNAEFRRPFGLFGGPLRAFHVFRTGERSWGYFFKLHHLIADGWSIKILTDQIAACLLSEGDGERNAEGGRPSFVKRVETESDYLGSPKAARDKAYWSQRLSAARIAASSNLASNLPGARRVFPVAPDFVDRLRVFVKTASLSMNAFWLAVAYCWLSRGRGDRQALVGIPVMGRSGRRERETFGMFSNLMSACFALNPDSSAIDYLQMVARDLRKDLAHQCYPASHLVRDLGLWKKGGGRLFDFCVNCYNTSLVSRVGELTMRNEEYFSGFMTYPCQLVVKEWEQGLTLTYDYQESAHSASGIERMHQEILDLAGAFLEAPRLSIGSFSGREKDVFDCRKERFEAACLHESIARQTAEAPDRIACEDACGQMSYGELDRRAKRLARYLAAEVKAGPGRLIAVFLAHECSALVGILGVLKTGAAYVPLDPTWPPERVKWVLEDCDCACVLANAAPAWDFQSEERRWIFLHEAEDFDGDSDWVQPAHSPACPAYLIYTSGSTGVPKGTVVSHANAANYLEWARETYLATSDDVFGLHSSFAFDLTVTALFAPLLGGNRIIFFSEEEGFAIPRILRQGRVDVLKLTPAHLEAALMEMAGEEVNTSVRSLILGGENLSRRLAADATAALGPALRIFNEYGPTETTVGCMIHLYEGDSERTSSVAIGRPIKGLAIYLLDERGCRVGSEETGELHVGGAGVAMGYLRRAALTAERFRPDPFGAAGARMYATGDLAVLRSDDLLEYRERLDRQLKIGGRRIEPGEVEVCLEQYPGIQQAVVLGRESEGKIELAAYFTSREAVNLRSLRAHLFDKLPPYLVPRRLARLAEFPLTSNGKIDQRRLAETTFHEKDPEECAASPYRHAVFETLQEVLRVPAVTDQEDYFDLGGDSIKAIQISSRLRARGILLDVGEILAFPNLGDLAGRARASRRRRDAGDGDAGPVAPTPILRWFLSRNLVRPAFFHQSVCLELKQEIPAEAVARILQELVRRHDALRLRFDERSGEFATLPPAESDGICQFHDLTGVGAESQEAEMTARARRLKAGFRLDRGPLIGAALFRLGERRGRLVLVAHHLGIDIASWAVIFSEFAELWRSRREAVSRDVPAGEITYREWAAIVEEESARTRPDKPLPEKIAREDSRAGGSAGGCRAVLVRTFEAAETRQLSTAAHNRYGTQVADLLVAAAVAVLQEDAGRDVVVEIETQGRDHSFPGVDISKAVGWFTVMFQSAMRSTVDRLDVAIPTIKRQLREGQKTAFQEFLAAYGAADAPGMQDPDLRVNYAGDIDALLPGELFAFADGDGSEDVGEENWTGAGVEINAWIRHGRLVLQLVFEAGRYPVDRRERMADRVVQAVRAVLHHCLEPSRRELLPEEFNMVDIDSSELNALFE